MAVKIGIITINHNRSQILKLWLLSISRLRNDVGWFPVVCVSEAEDKKACEKAGVHHITQKNSPASEKWNTGAKWMLTQDVDYIMIVGSDDIISSNLMRNFISASEQNCDVMGIHDVYFYCSYGKHRGVFLHHTTPKMLGLCRTIHRRIVEKVNGNICPAKKSWGMDASVTKTITPHITSHCYVEGVVTDVKSQKNLNSITYWISKLKKEKNADLFLNFISLAERNQLNHLNISG